MSDVILKVEDLSKQYRLGTVGTGTLGHDLNRVWARIRGKEDPYLKIGAVNDRSSAVSSDYVWALKDINFEVKQGEILGIIGKNGAGKSTLLKILSRVTSPTSGSIKVGGRMASLLEVGTGMHPELTGRENIYLNGAILGMTKSEIASKIDEIIEFSGCQMYIDTPVKRYSSGMGVRLGFAVAAFLEPDILVVDEVLAVGDAEFQKKAIGKMQDISQTSGRTVLFVSHNMDSVQSLCTRAVLLEHGRIIEDNVVDKVVSSYLSKGKVSHSNLKDIVDRKGVGSLQFSAIHLGNQSDSKRVFKLGEKMQLNLFIANNGQSTQLDQLRVLIGVYNEREEGILRFDSNIDSEFAKIKTDNEFKISCIVKDELNIIPGRYSINLALFLDDTMQDYLQDKILFDVVNDNYLGSSHTLDNNNLAKVLYRHIWKINKT